MNCLGVYWNSHVDLLGPNPPPNWTVSCLPYYMHTPTNKAELKHVQSMALIGVVDRCTIKERDSHSARGLCVKH